MRVVFRALTAALLITGLSAAPAARAAATPPLSQRHACDAPTSRHAGCLAVIVTDSHHSALTARAAAAANLSPYSAADLRSAYRLPVSQGSGQTIAIVDAFDTPNAEADLAVYRETNGLPACTTANGCFKKVNQGGGPVMPPPDAGWSAEASLDLDMASAACPRCNLMLVEATDNTDLNLALTVDEAVALHANVVSNSYGGPEYDGETTDAVHYDHPGVPIIASSGDSGFGVSFPAAYGSVVAVGGTTLYRTSAGRRWAESAWKGAGSGCSAYVAKPRWQKDTLCDKRTVADVAAVADPNTPVAVYDTYGWPGWIAVGGTSAGSPLIAGMYGLAGNASAVVPGSYLYSHSRYLYDTVGGSNGFCGGSYLCTAVKGYDGPTGLGSPNGVRAF